MTARQTRASVRSRTSASMSARAELIKIKWRGRAARGCNSGAVDEGVDGGAASRVWRIGYREGGKGARVRVGPKMEPVPRYFLLFFFFLFLSFLFLLFSVFFFSVYFFSIYFFSVYFFSVSFFLFCFFLFIFSIYFPIVLFIFLFYLLFISIYFLFLFPFFFYLFSLFIFFTPVTTPSTRESFPPRRRAGGKGREIIGGNKILLRLNWN